MITAIFIIAVLPINVFASSGTDFSFRKIIGAPDSPINKTVSISVCDTDRVTIRISQITSGAKLVVSYGNSNNPITLDSIGTYYIILPPYSNTITVNIRAIFEEPSGYIAGSVSS